MNTPFAAIILAGGSGERFWPLSRQAKPKQFLELEGTGKSLIQATVERLEPLCGPEHIFVVTSQAHQDLVKLHLPDLPKCNLIIEHQARDTAAAILYATLHLRKKYGDRLIVGVFPSDHRITDVPVFHQDVQTASHLAKQTSSIITLGIQPTHPATGYGYIAAGALEPALVAQAYRVTAFLEKPDLATAQRLLETGNHTWNAGMFIFGIGTMIDAFRQHAPDILELLEAAVLGKTEHAEAFAQVRKTSIDYAIMEKASNIIMVPARFGWDDLGDWNALERLHNADQTSTNPTNSDQIQPRQTNIGLGQHLGIDTSGTILYGSQNDLMVTIGIEDVVIVRSENITLVVRKDRTQEIKRVIQQLKATPELAHLV
jgi:mannose-1-phosphate guanylyltransferase